MSVNEYSLTAEQLFQMTPTGFNLWRQDNDLPALLEYIKNAIPSFATWMIQSNINDETFLRAQNTGAGFTEEPEAEIVVCKTGDSQRISVDLVQTYKGQKRDGRSGVTELSRIAFTPFRQWSRQNAHVQRGEPSTKPLLNDTAITNVIENYKGRLRLDTGRINSSWLTAGRNLDFITMDSVTALGESTNHQPVIISYSSCHNFQFRDADCGDIRFHSCQMTGLIVQNSRLYEMHFEQCDLSELRCIHSTVYGLALVNCHIENPHIEVPRLQRFRLVSNLKERAPLISTDTYS